MKITKFILAIAVVALLGAGCAKVPVAQKNSNTNTPPPIGTSRSAPASGSFTVTIAPDGEFNPVTAFVKKGTAVTFKNTTNTLHHIVPSDDPNSKLADLDSKIDLTPGASFTYTFNKVGRWLYDDSKHPGFGGAVEVGE